MLDTRAEIRSLLGHMEFSSGRALGKFLICTLVASATAFLPHLSGLSDAGRWTLFILILAAGLWITESIPAFAVALLVIALEIAILGRPGGVFATAPSDWEKFVAPWSSPLLWLFFGGFVMARAAAKTALDRWFALQVLTRCGQRPDMVLLGVMAVTFCFSMFISNTATATMMLAVTAPLVVHRPDDDPYARSLMLAIPFAANIGGMGTIIGSPPNAIAAGALGAQAMDFPRWMLAGLPPAVILLALSWWYLCRRFSVRTALAAVPAPPELSEEGERLPRWKRWFVVMVFVATVVLWMSGPLHKIPSPVISFLPIVAFSVAGVLDSNDIRTLQWDVLLMLAGGLSLSIAVSETGLANWIVRALPISHLEIFPLALALAYLTAFVSNFMSNTAAANILVPIGAALATGFESHVVVPMALSASAAMCLPISTPPNAVVYASGRVSSKELLRGGLLIGAIAPLLVAAWCRFLYS